MEKVKINTEYIQLQNVLKIVNIINTGGEAKVYLHDNDVIVNNETERRRGRKLYPGDQVKIKDKCYLIEKDVDQ